MIKAASETVLVYRHRLIPLSEAAFVGRFYSGFERLSPVWLGYHLDKGASIVTDKPLRIGRDGALGALDRALFRHLGVMPPAPDLRRVKPRVIHALFGRGGAMALPLARALGVPLVVTFLGADATKEKHYQRRLIPPVYARRLAALQREAALFTCLSGFLRDTLVARGFPPEKIEVIHHGAAIVDVPPEPLANRVPYLLFVGRFVEKKGVTYLLDAMRVLRMRGLATRLVLIGDGPLGPQLREQARDIADIEFLGWLPTPEIRRWMRSALALCVPSVTAADGDAEGLPTVVFEAMSEGTPVVGSRHAGIPEAVISGDTGLLVAEADTEGLAASLAELIETPGLRQSLGAAASIAARERFDARRQSRRLEQALLRVADEARP